MNKEVHVKKDHNFTNFFLKKGKISIILVTGWKVQVIVWPNMPLFLPHNMLVKQTVFVYGQ